MFSTVVGLVLLVSFHVEGLACSDYSSEKSCNFKSSYSYWGCTWDGSSCSFGSCMDYSSTDATQCKNAMGGNQCAWNDTADPRWKCDAADCDDFDADEPTCTGNYANLNCVYRAGTCRPYRCGDYTTPEACAAKDKFGDATSSSCLWDATTTTCLSLSCRNFSLDSATCLAADGPQGAMSCYWSETSSTKCGYAGCSDFAADQSTCETNNGRLKCVYNGSWSSPLLKCSKVGCNEQTSKSACEGFGGCYWSLLGSCSTLQCSDLTSSGDDATKKAVCETKHPECHYDSTCKEGSGGAIAVGVPSSIAVFLLLLALLML